MASFQVFCACLFCSFLLVLPAIAQDSTQAAYILPVEKMPELSTGGGQAAIVKEIQKRINYSPSMQRKPISGRVFVSFVVTDRGDVNEVKVIKGLRPDCDAAAVKAIEQLPRLIPGKQNGKPFAYGLIVPVTFAPVARKGL